MAENEQMANPEVAPAWSKIDCEFYWTLRASLEQIGKEQGRPSTLFMIFICVISL